MLGISKTVPQQDELERALKAGIKGEVYLDQTTRGIYATDASIYQIEPLAVVIPRDETDALHAIKVARERRLPILPRGGGTSLAGQTVGRAIILDFSKLMNRVLEVNEAGRWARVEPGRVREELNVSLAKTGLHFGPETATANRANIGGMIGNNSSGTRSIVYGKTVDNILELDVALATGEKLHFKKLTPAEWREKEKAPGREGEIYRGVREIIEANREEIKARFPKVMRRVGGYNLDEFVYADDWNLAKLVVGSEGTLATTLEAKLALTPLPKAKAMGVIHYKRLPECLKSVAPIVKHGPSMVELLDRSILDPAMKHVEVSRHCAWIEGEPTAVLIVEFFGETLAEAEAKLDALIAEMKEKKFGYAWPKMLTAEEQGEVFYVRAKGQGLMIGAKGDAKAHDFIDDSAVPVEVLPDYIAEVVEICRELMVPVALYAHASVGLLHVRPVLNLKTAEDIQKMREIAERTFDVVKKYGGSWSGEHGDGLVRSFLNEKYFGSQVYNAFKQVKKLFDPEGLMNPGKIVDAQGIEENLRMGVQYRKLQFPTRYFYREEGGFDQAVEMCTGVGECRKTLAGTMCPSYRATRDEAHSTRGRANALRLAMTGQYGQDGMTSEGLHDVLDLCLSCKGCKGECPSNVDLAKLKEEFLAIYHDAHGSTIGEKFFAGAPRAAAQIAGPIIAPLANFVGGLAPARALMEKVLGLDRRRPLPKFTREPFPKWFARHTSMRGVEPGRPRVVLFDDTFMNFHEPQVGVAATLILEALGYRVELADAGCCGRTLISKGFLTEARDLGNVTLKKLNKFILEETPIVACEPSCLSALTDDLPDLVDNAQLGRRVAHGVVMLDVFLEREIDAGRIKKEDFERAFSGGGASRSFLVHGHCHQKALYGTKAMKRVLGMIPGATVSEIDSGCCGMAGSFGYEKEHYDLSLKIGEDRLFPAVRSMPKDQLLVASGFSCRHQIADGCQAKARHFAEALAGFIKK